MDMSEEKVLKFRRLAENIHSKNKELRKTILAPFIIAMKGDQATGRKLSAFLAASILRCPIIKEHDFDNYEEKTEENQARIGRKICELASCQLKSGHSVVIDAELANQNEFDLLQELSEINKTPLIVLECRVDDAERLWDCRDTFFEYGYIAGCIGTEFLEKPTSRYITPTNYNMGEIPNIPVEITSNFGHSNFTNVVPYALKDLRDHIDPNFESEETNDCDHDFLLNIDDEYQRRCWKCRQLVSGSFYHCRYCRLIVHRTCCYFPESLLFHNCLLRTVILKLRNVVLELDVDATCRCCMKLLSGQYYAYDRHKYFSTKDELGLFCLDCLIALPTKRRTKIHKHELLRGFTAEQLWCRECDASIDKNTIYYRCKTCCYSFDVYCLWLPETVEFDRHRHSFKLSIVPAVDSLPYYCEVCQNERDTESWIYYCAECDYPSHPRCIVDAPSVLRSISTQISISNKKLNKKLTDTKYQGCSSHLSIEGVLVKELPGEHSSKAKESRLLLKESRKETELPILIMTKGHSNAGRKLVALALATTLDCLLIDDDNLCEVTNIANEPKQVCYQEFSRIALSQLQIGLSVVFDSDLSHESQFFFLQDLAIATETPLIIIECKQWGEDIIRSDNKDYLCDTPKLIVHVTTPTFDGIKEFMPHILRYISARKRHIKEPKTPYCYRHTIPLGLDYDVSEGEICNRCSKQLSTPILKCEICALVLHKNCTELPLRINVHNRKLILEKISDDNDKVKCDFCNEFVKNHAYTGSDIMICLDCWFTPPKPTANLHEHPMQLILIGGYFDCKACGYDCGQRLRYTCSEYCRFQIGVKCGLLEETVPFDRHRHPFHLIISPEHVSNQYYCEVCGEERDKDHWVYCCVECDYFIHVRCLVPTGGCTPSDSWSSGRKYLFKKEKSKESKY